MNQLVAAVKPLLTGAKVINKKLAIALLGLVALAAFLINNAFSAATVQALSKYAEPNSKEFESSVSKTGAVSGQIIQTPSVYVHLVGEVLHPGMYVLESGARLIEAVIQAGGFTKKADETSVNLARVLTDGEQVLVLPRGAASNSALTGYNKPASAGLAPPISLNRGSQAELEQLPGVGPTLAQRIIDWRSANGGFKSISDLQNVAGIGDKMFAAIESQVTL